MAPSKPAKPVEYYETVDDTDNPGQKVRRRRTKVVEGVVKEGWRLRVYDPRTGTQKEKTFYGTYEDAIREMERQKSSVEARTVKEAKGAGTITVEDYTKAWLASYAWKIPPSADGSFPGQRRPYSTYAKAVTITSSYIIPMLGARTRLAAVSTNDIMTGIQTLKKVKDGGDPEPETRATVAGVCKSMFRDAVRQGYLTHSPADLVPMKWGVSSRRRRNLIPSILEMEKLATALDEAWKLPKWAADLAGPNGEGRGDILRLLSYTGMRWEEMAALLAEHVHLDKGYFVIMDTASESGGRREVRRGSAGEEAGKSDAAHRYPVIVDQAVPVFQRLNAIRKRGRQLEEARDARRQERGSKRGPNVPLEQRWTMLVCGEQGGFQSYGHWRKMLAKAREASGVDLTAHECRHIAASILIAAEVTADAVAEQMGHSTPKVTKLYRHLFHADRAVLRSRVSSKIQVLTDAELDELNRTTSDADWD